MILSKTYWSLLKTFYNGKKVPIIPPLLINDIISDFEAKANQLNNFFASQCTPLNNNSKIPENQTYKTNTKLFLIKLMNKDIINIIKSLNEDKVHGHDNISIRMLKICDTADIDIVEILIDTDNVEPLSIIFNNCVNQSMFPDI